MGSEGARPFLSEEGERSGEGAVLCVVVVSSFRRGPPPSRRRPRRVCGATVTVCSPTVFSGPFGMRTCALATLKSMRLSASATSALVTEPNRRPSTPAFCVMWTVRPLIFSPSACAVGEPIGGDLLELGPLVLELLDRRRGRAPRGALRDQEVARIAVLDLDDVAEVAEVGDLFQKNDLHGVVLRPCAGRCTAASPGSGRA